MSQSKHTAAPARTGRIPEGRGSATTAEGIAAERALLGRRGDTARLTRAARRLADAARADRRAT